uniref:Uncharacterized protein n=1 Tax=Desmodus rotundus TaxID=9430 RepID=K9IW52_DESRO
MSLCLSVLLINGISQSFNLISIGKYVLFRFIIITDIGIIFVSFFLSFFLFFFTISCFSLCFPYPLLLYQVPPYFFCWFESYFSLLFVINLKLFC